MMQKKVIKSEEFVNSRKPLSSERSKGSRFDERGLVRVLGQEFFDFIRGAFQEHWQKKIIIILKESVTREQVEERAALAERLHNAPCGPQGIIDLMERVDRNGVVDGSAF